MEPILSKEEISDLLLAIKDGRVSTDSIEDGKPYKPIPKATSEVDLFQVYVHEKTAETRIPNLDIILDNFASFFAVSLTNRQQRPFTVQRIEIESKNFQESIVDLHDKGAIGIFNIDPLKYGCLFHFDPKLSFALLEIMLGASSINESLSLDRVLTTIEINVLKNTMEGICGDLQKAFKALIDLEPTMVKVENNFRLVNIVDAETEMLIARFKVKTGSQSGEMRMIVPYIALEPVRDRFRDFVSISQAASSWGHIFKKDIMEMSTDVTARSGLLTMTIREILHLKKGDIVDLGYDPDEPLSVLVEDKPKFIGMPGERNGKQAISITGLHRMQ